MDDPLSHQGPELLNEKLVLRFFWRFSTFECALKRAGFLKTQDGLAEPNWKKFAETFRHRFGDVNRGNFAKAVELLMTHPPQRQVVKNGRLSWEAQARKSDEDVADYVLRLVKTVRNNLFHGGKYPDGDIAEITRNRNLLAASLSVLEGCARASPEVERVLADAA